MKLLRQVAILCGLLSSAAFAQFTTVTGTVTDPNGLPYAGGTISPTLVSSGSPTLSGFAYSPPTQPTGLDRSGKFTLRLGDNNVLSPGGSTWSFHVCSAVGTVAPDFGKGPVCFDVTGVTISGASQDIGVTLTAAALALTANFGSSGSITAVTIPEINAIYQVAQGGPVGFGSICPGNIGFATGTGSTQVLPTATRRAGITYFITPAASTSTVVGLDCGQNGNNSLFPIVGWNHYTTQFSIGSLTNARYWLGLATWNVGSGLGTNSVNILNTTKFATDTPASNTIGFRFSSGTDTTWKAVTVTAGGSSTIVDTLVTADTNFHVFEMTNNLTGTAIQFLIDGVVVATITTNIPPGVQTSDGLADIFWTGDNKNTVTSPSATSYMAQLTLK
jgi:hypothetical protein